MQTDYQIATKKFEEDPTVSNKNRLNEVKDALELFYEEKTKGIIIRARARWHEHGERSTRCFLNLEKRNIVKKHIRKLLVSGAITTDPFKIRDEIWPGLNSVAKITKTAKICKGSTKIMKTANTYKYRRGLQRG